STTDSMGPVALGEPPGGEPLLTRMCTPPSCDAACAISASTCALLVTSHGSAITRRFVAAAISCAAPSSGPLLRAATATLAPSRASSSAMALPMPRLPPVTIAFLPERPRSIACPFAERQRRAVAAEQRFEVLAENAVLLVVGQALEPLHPRHRR